MALGGRPGRAHRVGLGVPGPLLALLWDALILAWRKSMGCESVLGGPTGQDLEGIRIVNPFSTRPSELAG
jgi:hypothetical protein